jgi:hypothetical protein
MSASKINFFDLKSLFFSKSDDDDKNKTEKLENDIVSQIGWVTTAKDFCGELISGQSTSGRILVDFIFSTFFLSAYLNKRSILSLIKDDFSLCF